MIIRTSRPSKPQPKSKGFLVVLPFFSGDSWLARKCIDWYMELDGRVDYDCVLSCDTETDPSCVKEVAEKYFRSVRVFRYRKHEIPDWPYRQNKSFTDTAHYVAANHAGPWLWCETDSVGLKPGWIKAIEEGYRIGGKPFGGHLNPDTQIFNGVGIYPSEISWHAPNLLMAALVRDEKNKTTGGYPYQPPFDYYGSKQVIPKLHVMTSLTQHVWEVNGACPTFPTEKSVTDVVRPGIVLFHRNKDGTLIDRLREAHRKHLDIQSGNSLPEAAVYVKTEESLPKHELFTVTFRGDVEWMPALLRSVKKYATGFSGHTVMCPEKDKHLFSHMCTKYGAKLVTMKQPEGKGFLAHMVEQCFADQHCPTADYIFHVDSDCVFIEPAKPSDYFVNNLPIQEMLSYKNAGDARVWQDKVVNALGWTPEHETMQAFPIIYPRHIYPATRAAVERHTKLGFREYVMSGQNKFPQSFCEFNTLGAVARRDFSDRFHWINLDHEKRVNMRMWQAWSKGGPDRKATHGDILGMTPREIWVKLGIDKD